MVDRLSPVAAHFLFDGEKNQFTDFQWWTHYPGSGQSKKGVWSDSLGDKYQIPV